MSRIVSNYKLPEIGEKIYNAYSDTVFSVRSVNNIYTLHMCIFNSSDSQVCFCIFLYLVAYLSFYHEKAIKAL